MSVNKLLRTIKLAHKCLNKYSLNKTNDTLKKNIEATEAGIWAEKEERK